jgi:hypothetical protein
MADSSDRAPDYGAKHLGNYKDLGRGPVTSYFRRLAAEAGHAPDAGIFARLTAFTSSRANWGAWFGHVMRYIGNSRHAFQTYKRGSGLHEVGEQLQLSVVGDWATGTDEAQQVIWQMVKHNPDYTIHLGDVYYVGDKPELEENCLGVSHSKKTGVKWLAGSKGSFALSGNHEMYAAAPRISMSSFPDSDPSIRLRASQRVRKRVSFVCAIKTGESSASTRVITRPGCPPP